MSLRRWIPCIIAAALAAQLLVGPAVAAPENAPPQPGQATTQINPTSVGIAGQQLSPQERIQKRTTQADRLAAADRAKAANAGRVTAQAVPAQGGTPNYFGPEPNWAWSPPLNKFVDTLPGLGVANKNNLNQYIPVAVPDTTTYPGSDYYEIELGEYTEKMHSQLNPTTLRGYRQTNTTDSTVSVFSYLGPMIVAQENRPVRIKFTNKLPTGAGGNLFLPVDPTVMGAGEGPKKLVNGVAQDCDPTTAACDNYTQNRATLHLHGGATPWISDGTPHQWITPANETTPYPEGVSVQNVPDMNACSSSADGCQTFYYSNQQSARLMFYHDHAYGITRLNVYAGESAGYLVRDSVENGLISAGTIPGKNAGEEIPLIIQDKTFIDPARLLAGDPTWPFPIDATRSNLWYPHVYMPNQNPNDAGGINPFGRWDYGPWFWPPWPATNAPKVVNGQQVPNVPDLSAVVEAFMDTPLVNGTAYPSLTVDPKAYRFRILNASDDRMWNLQLYQASNIVSGITVTNGGSGYTTPPAVTITPAPGDTAGKGATATAVVDLTVGSPTYGQVTAITLDTVGSGYTAAPIVAIAPPTAGTTATATAALYTAPTEVGMVPAVPGAANFPVEWTAKTTGQPGDILDMRSGGVPDPATIGPSMIQIGTEGGFLPAPVVWTNIPTGYDRDPKSITVGNVKEHNLFLGPAERADVIVDFSQFAGKTLILYNDGPAPVPATDSRLDYYTANPDLSSIGGNVPTQAGKGPNTRTVMQIKVNATTPAPAFNKAPLDAAFASTATAQGVFAQSQQQIIVPQAPYNSAYNANYPSDNTAYARVRDTSLTFTPAGAAAPVTTTFKPKAIQELFENDWGRMSAFLGVELPFTNGFNQTTIDYKYLDPVTENIDDTANLSATPVGTTGDGTQLWYIVHNGVDTHPIHFHLFDVQVVNRVDWAGVVKPPEANELGWKETVRMNPLENILVALRPTSPKTPFGVPDSTRLLDPTMPAGSTMYFRNIDPTTGNPITVTNQMTNFGWEYVWHCHILSHEEMDMMRPVKFNVARSLPAAPTVAATGSSGSPITLTWNDATPFNYATNTPATTIGNAANEVGFRIERATYANGTPGPYVTVAVAPANSTSYTDTTSLQYVAYDYRVVAFNAAGDAPSNVRSFVPSLLAPAAPTNLTAVQQGGGVALTWTDVATTPNESGYVVERSSNGGTTWTQVGTTLAANSTTYTDSGVVAGTTYQYRVKAVLAGTPSGTISSPYSNTATVTVIAVANAPSNLTATQVGTQVNLAWTDNSTNETGFVVERATGGGAFAQIGTTLPANTTTYSDTTVAAGTTYQYRVKAMNGAVSSAYSNVATIAVIAPPAAPTGLAFTLQSGQVNLTWGDNATNETGYVVERALGAGAFAQIGTTLPANTTTYKDTTAASGSTYQYRVMAVNGAVNSAYSNVVSVTIPTVTSVTIGSAPASPQLPGSSVTLTATPLPNGVNAEYLWWIATPGSATWTVLRTWGGASYAWNTTGLATGTYSIAVWARALGSSASFDSNASIAYQLASTLTPVSSVTIGASPAAPQLIGASVTFTATPLPAGINAEYQWWVAAPGSGTWTLARAWGGNTYSWNTTGLATGTWSVAVWARAVGSTASFEANASVAYQLNTATLTPVSSVTIGVSPASPRQVGTSVTFTATPLPAGINAEYQWWVAAPGSGTWTLARAWGGNTYSWNTTGLATGTWSVAVWARAVGSTASFEANASVAYQLNTATLTPVSSVTITASPASSATRGTNVTFTAAPLPNGVNAEYQWWVAAPGSGTWTLARAWGGNTYSWNTTGLATGTWSVAVWARAVGSTASFEANAAIPYSLK